MTDKQNKLHILRELENFIYQVAYYMLKDEQPALEASKQAVKEVMNDTKFFQMDDAERIKAIRQLTIQKSLRVYFEAR